MRVDPTDWSWRRCVAGAVFALGTTCVSVLALSLLNPGLVYHIFRVADIHRRTDHCVC